MDKIINIKSEHLDELNITVPSHSFIEFKMKADINKLPKVNSSLIKSTLHKPIDSKKLKEIAKNKKKCVILIDDPSRPTPTHLIVPLIIEEIKAGGITDENIRIFVANGTHKKYSNENMREKIGSLIDRYEVVQNEADIDENYSKAGTFKSGNELFVHKKVMECDLKIGVGQIILSPFAGFTGGAKIVLPGACNKKAIFQNHLLAFDAHAHVGEVEKNPVRMDMDEAAEMISLDFIYNLTLDKDSRVVLNVCGNPKTAYKSAIQTAMDNYGIKTDTYLDMILYNTFPSDRSLYYTISKADMPNTAVKKGGTIVIIGSCREGIGNKEFYHLFSKTSEEIKYLAMNGQIRADWAGISYRIVKILEEKKIVLFVPKSIKESITIENKNVSFCDDLDNFVKTYLKDNVNAKIGYISSQFALPIVE